MHRTRALRSFSVLLSLIFALTLASWAAPNTTAISDVTATNASPTLGDTTTLTATVTDNGDSVAPGTNNLIGYVVFSDSVTGAFLGSMHINIGAPTPVTFNLPIALAGPASYSVVADFVPTDANFTTSGPSTNPLAVTVAKRATSITADPTATPDPVKVGVQATFNVTVNDTAAVPTGTAGSFVATTTNPAKRVGHASAPLGDGTLFVSGGLDATPAALDTVEIYDPSVGAHGSFTSKGSVLTTPRVGHTATTLQDGTVLIVGGSSDGTPANALATAEIYDPVLNNSTPTAGSLLTARMYHTAVLLPNGKVLIAGGENQPVATPVTLSSIEIYDPVTQTFSQPASPANDITARFGHTATVIGVSGNNVAILIAGGSDNSYEIYTINQATGLKVSSVLTANWTGAPQFHTATLLPSGDVLIAGGTVSGTPSNALQLYSVSAGAMLPVAATLDQARTGHTASLLGNGYVLFVDGSSTTAPTGALQSAVVYVPAYDPQGKATPSVNSDTNDHPNDCTLTLKGDGTSSCVANATATDVGGTPAPFAHTLNVDYTGTDSDHSAAVTTTVTMDVNPGDAVIVVTPYNVPYDKTAHTATFTATGALGVDLSAKMNVSGTTHTNHGTYNGDPWTFHDPSGNYNDANGTVNDAITPINATIQVNAYNVSYDGNSHTATFTATGAQGEDLSADMTVSGTTHTNANDYPNDPWSFHDPNGNYNDANGTVHDIIGTATATITVTGYSVTYDGNNHTATVAATGAHGEDLSADVNVTGTTHTNAGNYNSDPWTFHDPAGNYPDKSGTVVDVIAQATPIVTWSNPADITYGTALSATQLNATFTWVVQGNTVNVAGTPTYTPALGTVLNAASNQNLKVDFAPTDTTNYTTATKTVQINVLKATPTVTWSNPADIVYGTALSATQLNATFTWIVNGSTVTVTGAPTYNPAQGTVLIAGNGQNLKVDFAPGDTTNYNAPATNTVQINVNARPVTVTVDPAQFKNYGDNEPVLTYSVGGSGLVGSDSETDAFNGTIVRVAGQGVTNSPYAITQGTLAPKNNANGVPNYAISSFTGSNFAINPRAITVTADLNQQKFYGDNDPNLIFTVGGSGLATTNTESGNPDTPATVFAGQSLTRAAGQNAGSYGILQGTIAANANYSITYTGNLFVINPRQIMVTADSNQQKFYGDPDPTFTFTVGGMGLATSNTQSGNPDTIATVFNGQSLQRLPGQQAVGSYDINQGTLSNPNYAITYGTSKFTIVARQITVIADSQTKIYGENDPALTFTVGGMGLAAANTESGNPDTQTVVFTNSLQRLNGQNVGSYSINQGSLATNANYTITGYTNSNLLITKRSVTVGAVALQKYYGQPEPGFDPTTQLAVSQTSGMGLAQANTQNGQPDTLASVFAGQATQRDPGEDVLASGAYVIRQGSIAANANYALTYQEGVFNILPAIVTATPKRQSQATLVGFKGAYQISASVSYDTDTVQNGGNGTLCQPGFTCTPVGTVTFMEGTTQLGKVQNLSVPSGAPTTLTSSALSDAFVLLPGTHTISVVYTPTTNSKGTVNFIHPSTLVETLVINVLQSPSTAVLASASSTQVASGVNFTVNGIQGFTDATKQVTCVVENAVPGLTPPTCTVDVSNVNGNSFQASITVVTTTVKAEMHPPVHPGFRQMWELYTIGVPAIFFIALGPVARRRTRRLSRLRLFSVLMLVLVLISMLGAVSCGGGSFHNPNGDGPVPSTQQTSSGSFTAVIYYSDVQQTKADEAVCPITGNGCQAIGSIDFSVQ